MSMSAYYTQVKSPWDEYTNYRPLLPSDCGELKTLTDYQQQAYVMHFLMGLNENFSHIRGQILLLASSASYH